MSSNIPFFTIFIIQLLFIGLVVILSVISIFLKTLNNLWAYMILASEAVGMLFI
jgi:hypothetical protein